MKHITTKYFLIKGIPIATLLIYFALTLLAYRLSSSGTALWVWGLPFGYGLLALIAGEPIRMRLGVTYKWLAAYTRSLAALYAATAFGLALL